MRRDLSSSSLVDTIEFCWGPWSQDPGGFSSVLHAASSRYGGYYFSRSTELSDSVEASCVAPGRLARARRRGASRAGSNRRSGTSDRVEVVFYLGGMALCPTLLVISNGWLIAC